MAGALVAEGVVKPLVELMMTGNTMAQTESVSLLAVLSVSCPNAHPCPCAGPGR